jgi:shikimate dehydrogenase
VDYRAIEASPEQFPAALEAFAADGGVGANVTLPHKEAAFALCTTTTSRAQRAGAVNTLLRKGERWHGDNTDGIGLVRDLTGRHGLDLRGRRVLLLGAGGAARGNESGFSLPLSLVNSMTTAVDLNYGEASIPFLAWARAAGCRNSFDGLGMLVEQAAESFQQWHGMRPETDAIYAELRAGDALLVTAD